MLYSIAQRFFFWGGGGGLTDSLAVSGDGSTESTCFMHMTNKAVARAPYRIFHLFKNIQAI